MIALAVAAPKVDTGDTAWMLVATALVLMMTPALGLFYAGLVRAKSTLNTFMMSIAAIAVATVAWAAVGYSLAFDGSERADHPPPPLLRVPGDLLHHHRRTHLGRGGRAHAVRAVPRVRRALGDLR